MHRNRDELDYETQELAVTILSMLYCIGWWRLVATMIVSVIVYTIKDELFNRK